MAIGVHGLTTQAAARLAETEFRQERGIATIQHQQMEDLIVQLLDKTNVTAKLLSVLLVRYFCIYPTWQS